MPALEGMSFDHVLLTTRAVRKRLDLHRPVEMEVLRECFELALQAPTQSDTQGFHFIIVTDKGQREALGDLFRQGHAIYKSSPDSVSLSPLSRPQLGRFKLDQTDSNNGSLTAK